MDRHDRMRSVLALLLAFALAACDAAGGAADVAAPDAAGGSDVPTPAPDATGGSDVPTPAPDATGGSDVPTPAPDAAGGDTFETCLLPRTPEFLLQTLELVSADGQTRVRLRMEPGEGVTVGETFAYHLYGFALERDGALVCVTDEAALDYVWGHHNWDEVATATAGGETYVVTMVFAFPPGGGDGAWTDEITARDAAGAVLWGPLDLPTARCEAEGNGALNGCFRRDTVDL